VSASAVRGKDGNIHVGIANLDPENPIELSLAVDGADYSAVAGRILTADRINAANTFDAPDTVAPKAFDGARIEGGRLIVVLPAKALVMLDVS
jgi:alpha-N-arabinofuranosidase